VEVIYGGSGELAAQLRHGAELDALFLASEHPIVDLQRVGLLGEIEGPMIRNSLVLTGSSDRPAAPMSDQISEAERVCIGTLGVPAGDYARIWLEEEGQSIDSLVEFGHVRAVLAAVESGSCELGFVYATDLREDSSLEVLARWEGSPRYAFALASGAPEVARSLGVHLHEGRAEFEKAGFVVESP
jgi:ABC-type molybdate transport system substrate-binding protein